MKGIHALSLNTAVDMRMQIPQFVEGGVIRSENYGEFAAGKAVNSARAIACLGGQVNLCCFSGTNDVDLFSATSPSIRANVLGVDGFTRRNLTLVNKKNELICHIQNHGYSVTVSQLDALESLFVRHLTVGDVVIISGSLPAGTPATYLNDLVQRLAKFDAVLLLDVDPPLLAKVNCERVRLVKPNIDELSRLAGRPMGGVEDMVKVATDLIRSQVVVVSLGQNGAIWIDREERSYVQAKANVHDQGTGDVIGCGDSMIGAFALGFALNKAPLDILKMGISAGYANLFVEGPGVLDSERYEQALVVTEVSKLERF